MSWVCPHDRGPLREETGEAVCERCDRPLFYPRTTPVRTRLSRPVSHRRPKVKGLQHDPVRVCPKCGEMNAMPDNDDRATARCHRDKATLFPDLAALQHDSWRLPATSSPGTASTALPAPDPSAVPVRPSSAGPATRDGRWPDWLIPALTAAVGVLAAVALVLLVILVLDIAA